MDEIIKKIKLGDKDSAAELVKVYYDEIYFYILKLTLNKDLSYDLTQEVFVRILNKIHTLKSSSNLKAWIYKVAYNYVMSYFKITKNNKLTSIENLEFIPSKVNVEDEVISKEASKNVLSAVLKLDSIYKDAILLRYYHNLSISEIAAILETNENTIKTHLTRGLDKLKSYFGSGDISEE